MPVRRKNKTQYVEHSEEHVGAEMKPFVAFLAMQENQVEKSNNNANTPMNATPSEQPTVGPQRKVRFWKRVTAFFS